MRWRIIVFLIAIGFLFCSPQLVYSASSQKAALVIGNGDYAYGPLRNPPNDADDMANLLDQLGFEVTKKLVIVHRGRLVKLTRSRPNSAFVL